MSQDTTLAGMPTNKRNDILWGRKGLPPEFYGSELIAEALFEVLKTMNRSTMEGFLEFSDAFRKHPFGFDTRVAEENPDCIAPPRWFNPDGVNLSLLGLDHVWGIGAFDNFYGMVWRSVTEMPTQAEVGDWQSKSQWDKTILQNEDTRRTKPEQMPRWQISHMLNKRVFLTRNGRMFVVDVAWEATTLSPTAYKPTAFRPTKLTFRSLYGVRQKLDMLELVMDYGLDVAIAVLSGLNLALQSSNYHIRKALEPNEKAGEMLAKVLDRTNS